MEMNCNPALHTSCEVLKEVIPSTVVETLGKFKVKRLCSALFDRTVIQKFLVFIL